MQDMVMVVDDGAVVEVWVIWGRVRGVNERRAFTNNGCGHKQRMWCQCCFDFFGYLKHKRLTMISFLLPPRDDEVVIIVAQLI